MWRFNRRDDTRRLKSQCLREAISADAEREPITGTFREQFGITRLENQFEVGASLIDPRMEVVLQS